MTRYPIRPLLIVLIVALCVSGAYAYVDRSYSNTGLSGSSSTVIVNNCYGAVYTTGAESPILENVTLYVSTGAGTVLICANSTNIANLSRVGQNAFGNVTLPPQTNISLLVCHVNSEAWYAGSNNSVPYMSYRGRAQGVSGCTGVPTGPNAGGYDIQYIGLRATTTNNLTVTNSINGSVITGLCTTIGGQTVCSTDTSLIIPANVTQTTYNLTVTSIGAGDGGAGTYFNTTLLNADLANTQNFSVSTAQAWLNVTARQRYTNNQIVGFNVTNGLNKTTTSTSSALVPANTGDNNVQFSHAGNYTLNKTCAASSLSTSGCAVTGVYDALYNVTAAFQNGTSATTFTVRVTNNTLGGNIMNASTTNGTAWLPLLRGMHYAYAMSATGAAAGSGSQTVSAATGNYTFLLYPYNSVNLTVYDETTGQKLSSKNITVYFTGEDNQYNYTAINGSLFVSDLSPDTYNVLLSTSGYFTRNYVVTVSNGSYQTLDAMLINNTPDTNQEVTFTVTDLTSNVVESALLNVETLQGTAWASVETRYTDFSGQAKFTFDTTRFYRITVSKEGYVTKQSQIQPTSTTYTIRLSSVSTAINRNVYDDVSYLFSPSNYTIGPGLYNFTFVIASDTGSLQYYGMTDGTTTINTSGNPAGGTNYITKDFSSQQRLTTQQFTYWFKTVDGSEYRFTRTYTIGNHTEYGNNTMANAPTKYNGDIGTGGKIIFGMIIIVVVMLGLSTFISGSFLGIIGLLLIIAMWGMGLFPLWISAVFGLMVGLAVFVKGG